MFTGIITDVGQVMTRTESGAGAGDVRLEIATAFDAQYINIGESICCNGVCLTVVEKGSAQNQSFFSVDVSAETAWVTSPAAWQAGAAINLERALKMGDDISGHVVTGHVDGLATILDIFPAAQSGDADTSQSRRLRLKAAEPLHRYIAAKGSVTLHGVSLTVNQVDGAEFTVNIIPHTWQHTSFAQLQPGDVLHLEIDILARYMARWLQTET